MFILFDRIYERNRETDRQVPHDGRLRFAETVKLADKKPQKQNKNLQKRKTTFCKINNRKHNILVALTGHRIYTSLVTSHTIL